MRKILRICGILIAALILQMHGELIAQTVDEGIVLFQQKKFAEAKSVFEKILDKDDNNAEAHYRLGLVYLHRSNSQRNVDEAVDQLEKAVDLKPDSADYHFLYGVAIAEKTQKAGFIKQAFLAPKIKNAFKRAVELNPRHIQARLGLAQYYLSAPSIAGGDETEGWKQVDEAIKLDEVQGRSVKASFLERAKKNDDAEKEYKILAASKPQDGRTWRGYGYFCVRTKRYDEAITYFKKYVELRPDTADSFQCLGDGFLRKGDADQAISMFRKSLEIDKDFLSSLEKMGEAYKIKGQKKEAKEMFMAVLSHNEISDSYREKLEKKLKEVE
jgi:Tfp pilus assembly protein PilF